MGTDHQLTRKSNTMRDRLLSFFHSQDVLLNADEERTKIRIEEVHRLLRTWQYKRQEIVEMIQKRFGVSQYRAERDISDCHYIFGKSYEVDKSFIAAQLIEEIQDSIRTAKNMKKLEMLPKLYDSLSKAIQQLPDNYTPPAKAKKIFVFNIHGNKQYDPKMDPMKAIDILKQQHHRDVEDIDHEPIH
jgi:hypothetical protein